MGRVFIRTSPCSCPASSLFIYPCLQRIVPYSSNSMQQHGGLLLSPVSYQVLQDHVHFGEGAWYLSLLSLPLTYLGDTGKKSLELAQQGSLLLRRSTNDTRRQTRHVLNEDTNPNPAEQSHHILTIHEDLWSKWSPKFQAYLGIKYAHSTHPPVVLGPGGS